MDAIRFIGGRIVLTINHLTSDSASRSSGLDNEVNLSLRVASALAAPAVEKQQIVPVGMLYI
jgi:hypothetical protein